MYEAVIATQALPWARLGVARAQIESGAAPAGKRTLESLIADQPGFADAYDVMGRVQVDQGQFAEALATYRTATQLTPGSIARLQRQGMLAFYLGENDEAKKALERATLMGISSKMFDFQTIVLLAVTRFTDRDSKGLQRCLDNMNHALEKAPKSMRLQRFASVITIFNLMLQRQVAQVVAEVRAMAEDIKEGNFDFEAASNMVAMLAHLTAAELQLDAAEGWIDTLALRFCTTRSLSELLARAGQVHEPFATPHPRTAQRRHRAGRAGDVAQPGRRAARGRQGAAERRRAHDERQADRHGAHGAAAPRREDPRRRRPDGHGRRAEAALCRRPAGGTAGRRQRPAVGRPGDPRARQGAARPRRPQPAAPRRRWPSRPRRQAPHRTATVVARPARAWRSSVRFKTDSLGGCPHRPPGARRARARRRRPHELRHVQRHGARG